MGAHALVGKPVTALPNDAPDAAVRSAPGQGRAERHALYGGRWERQDGSGTACRTGNLLDHLGEPHRKRRAFLYLLSARGSRVRRLAQLLKFTEQDRKVLRQKLLPKREIEARAGKVGFGDRRESVH